MPVSPPIPPNLLIVDDDETIRRLLVIAAQDHGWRPQAASNGAEALGLLNTSHEAVLLDHGLPEIDGLQTLIRIREVNPDIPVVILTGLNDAETAVQALRAGANDYVTKPFELRRLFDILSNCREKHSSLPVVPKPRGKGAGKVEKIHFTSSNSLVRQLLKQMELAAKLDSTILLTGESGTGKSFFAREIHRMSNRGQEEFITVSCPALPRELLESELFGHERGSFTGATASRAGRFEQASKGTLFLDEIGDLPQELQPKLLNVLQDREFFRVGGNRLLKTNARVIAATNVNLRHRMDEGLFREDLYYRLNIIELNIPPLRSRMEDIEDIAIALLERIAGRRGKGNWEIQHSGIDALKSYDWPGNVRQLENVLERATAFSEKSALGAQDFLPLLEDRRSPNRGTNLEGLTLQEIERNAFIQTYLKNGKNKAKTARDLGISERSVYNLLGRHGLK
ncbi:MAG: sigma-54 dependent transcriptional regulator [Luteolibacter sp.]